MGRNLLHRSQTSASPLAHRVSSCRLQIKWVLGITSPFLKNYCFFVFFLRVQGKR
uniref:Uncharacterized protein n=1 Tax=Anguilla anguilla TaxID=7936 RepID=A0A0E9WHV3_ANGAN